MDYHPLTTPNTVITDALNATFLTYNGNELMLQNDMGNTTIQDATTGNIMGLSPGFVPVGMKEHGGVLYIASYNPTTKEGELGTIPSPLFNYTYDPEPKGYNNIQYNLVTWPTIPAGQPLISITSFYCQDYIQILDRVFNPGEQFIVGLQFTEPTIIKRKQVVFDNTAQYDDYPLFTRYENQQPSYGMFSLQLFAGNAKRKLYYPLNTVDNRPQNYYEKGDEDKKSSDYWFLTVHGDQTYQDKVSSYDLDRMSSNIDSIGSYQPNMYGTFPNVSEGRLYLKIVPETTSDYAFVINTTNSDGISIPFYYKSVRELS